MNKTLKARTIALAVVMPLVLAIGTLVAVGSKEPALQKLMVGSGADGLGSPAEGVANSQARAATNDSSQSYRQPAFPFTNYVLARPLPDLADRAPAYRYQAGGDARAAAVSLARTLGLNGDPLRQDGSWSVHDGDLTLVVNEEPGLPWFLAQGEFGAKFGGAVPPDNGVIEGGVTSAVPTKVFPSKGESVAPGRPADCPITSTSMPEKGEDIICGGGFAPGVTPPEPVRPADLPDQKSAEAIGRSLFERLGWSTQGLRADDGFSVWYLSAPMRLGNIEVLGVNSILVGPNGRVVGANGMAAVPERLGDYPLIGVKEAFSRLQQGRYFEPYFVGDQGQASLTSGAATTIPSPPPMVSEVVPPPELTREQAEALKGLDAVLAAPDRVTTVPDAPTCVPGEQCKPTTSDPVMSDPVMSDPVMSDPPIMCPPIALAPAVSPECQPPTVAITGARLVLVQANHTLVPAYVFEVGLEFGGVTLPVAAVVDDLLDLSGR